MTIKLTHQEIVLLQKIRQKKLTIVDHNKHPHVLSDMYYAGLYVLETRLAKITNLGNKVLEQHLPVIVNTSDVSAPQPYQHRRR